MQGIIKMHYKNIAQAFVGGGGQQQRDHLMYCTAELFGIN